MGKGRPRKPTALHELSGTFDRHPERKKERANEPKPDGPLGPPPASFLSEYSPTAKALLQIWNELVEQVPPGVLTSADRWHVELACRLMYRVRNDRAKAGDYSRLDVLLGKMGMNPADRSKVNVVPTAPVHAPTNPFIDLVNEESEEVGKPN
ncbi:MAG TPA: hypothetical protein VKX41_15165 [Alloacidobacterium sp.]|jgi:hypothetical protein|nr:hypothetical protein [Alloacidobacterium sp.]